MASRSNTNFQKRQKELARAEKRQDIAARAERRRMGKKVGLGGPPIEAINPADLGLPSPEDISDDEVKAEA